VNYFQVITSPTAYMDSFGLQFWDDTMKRKQPAQKRTPDLCSEPRPDDGIDPRDLVRESARKKGGRKSLQLCAQVAEALNYAFAAVCNDDVVRELVVVAVQPAPDESRLLVTVGPLLPGPCNSAEVLAHLHQVLGKLRSEVAATIHRKKIPELTFCVAAEVVEH
jgi:ribosome-binding factor A